MPFTFSHAAALVPLVKIFKNKVSVTGLAIGSMMPDAEYFIRMQGFSEYGHTWEGILWFDVPVGIVLAFIFHNLVRNSLISHLPLVLQVRLQSVLLFNWNKWVVKNGLLIILCLAVGSASHIIWDGFTHAVADWLSSVLQRHREVGERENFFIYYLFFGINSIAGLIGLAFYAWKLPVQLIRIQASNKFPYWSIVAMITLAILIVRVLLGGDLPFISYVDSSIAALMIAILITSVIDGVKKGNINMGKQNLFSR